MLLGTSDDKAIICNDGSSHQQNGLVVSSYQRDCLRFCLFADGDIRADDFLS